MQVLQFFKKNKKKLQTCLATLQNKCQAIMSTIILLIIFVHILVVNNPILEFFPTFADFPKARCGRAATTQKTWLIYLQWWLNAVQQIKKYHNQETKEGLFVYQHSRCSHNIQQSFTQLWFPLLSFAVLLHLQCCLEM